LVLVQDPSQHAAEIRNNMVRSFCMELYDYQDIK